ncbi:MAG: sugar phosphate isomerase/epimerase [bacterium]|nr:sugar phosphate isomerase/epimerase [bacterium]
MHHYMQRRSFFQAAGIQAAGAAAASCVFSNQALAAAAKPFEISLAQWSLNRNFFSFLGLRNSSAEKLDPQDFAGIAKREFGIDAVEYVNQFYMEAVRKPGYLEDLKKKAADAGVTNVLIMCDREGNLGDPDFKQRITAVRNHIKWLEWAQALGCHSIRVNAASDPKLSYDQQLELAADGLRRLCEIADTYDVNVIVENHGGLSSHGRWLASVMQMVDHDRCGTLPDFGNFRRVVRGEGEFGELDYDRYLGTYELMPYAKGASAKSYAFDDEGNETTIDFRRIMSIVCHPKFNFSGHVGIEYEGQSDSFEGIKKTKALLEKIRGELSA